MIEETRETLTVRDAAKAVASTHPNGGYVFDGVEEHVAAEAFMRALAARKLSFSAFLGSPIKVWVDHDRRLDGEQRVWTLDCFGIEDGEVVLAPSEAWETFDAADSDLEALPESSIVRFENGVQVRFLGQRG